MGLHTLNCKSITIKSGYTFVRLRVFYVTVNISTLKELLGNVLTKMSLFKLNKNFEKKKTLYLLKLCLTLKFYVNLVNWIVY